jgi:hypothetical protein
MNKSEVRCEQAVAHVGIGEVFVIAGQSNSANYGEELQKPATGLVSAFDGEKWSVANDPQPGATGTKGSFIPSFGDTLARKTGVPVGVVCIGVGSTSVREWLPRDTVVKTPPTTGAHVLALAQGGIVSSGELFNNLVRKLNQFSAGGIRAVLWHQGESDWHQAEEFHISTAEYHDELGAVISASRAAAKWDVPWFVALVSYHGPTDVGSPEFRSAQQSLADNRLTFTGPNTDELTGDFREKKGQGVHMSAAGLKRHGELWAEVISQWLER